MTYFLKDPANHGSEIITIRNTKPTIQLLQGHIEGIAGWNRKLTPGSSVTYHSDGTTWRRIGYTPRKILVQSNLVANVPIGGTETDLGVDFIPSVEGVWLVTGGFKMRHFNVGNNNPVGGELILRNDTQGNIEINRIPWGVGRTNDDADFYVTVARQLSTDAPNVNEDDVFSVWAINTGSGDLECETPSGIEYTGPH